jgi:hypothetical protein
MFSVVVIGISPFSLWRVYHAILIDIDWIIDCA